MSKVLTLVVLFWSLLAAQNANASFRCQQLFFIGKTEQVATLNGNQDSLNKVEQKATKSYQQKIYDPFTLEHAVRIENKDQRGDVTAVQLKRLDDIFNLPAHSDRQAKSFDEWVVSEPHALYLYNQFIKRGLSSYASSYAWLLKNNAFFIDAVPVRGPPGSLITYGFEKEGTKNEVSMLYRDPRFTDEQWLAKPEDSRMQTLKKLAYPEKHFIDANRIQSTTLKPEYLDGFSVELSNGGRKGFAWELRHKAYEFSLPRVMSQIREVSQIFKETHSFHTHLVFELPKKYEHFESFSLWSKWVNDYLVLKGMEEGLHGNYLTNLAEHKKKLNVWQRTKESFRSFTGAPNRILPNRLDSVDKFAYKFFSMGVRSHLYGEASHVNNIKIGLEFRDVTRKLSVLEQVLRKSTESVSQYAWEKVRGDSYIGQSYDRSLTAIQSGIPGEMAERLPKKWSDYFLKIAPTVRLGFLNYESGRYLDYKTGTLFEVRPDQAQRIAEARRYLVEELVKIQKNVDELRAKGETVDSADVEMAVKMSLSEWAKKAKVSELFERF